LAESSTAPLAGRQPRTGILIREILQRTANPLSIHDVYTWLKVLYREAFPREKPPNYENVRKYVYYLRRLGLVQTVRTEPASRPYLSDKSLIALTPFGSSPESDPYWRDPLGALFRGELPPPGGGGGGGGGGRFGSRPGGGGGAVAVEAAPEESAPERRRRRKTRGRRAKAAGREGVERVPPPVNVGDLIENALTGKVELQEAADLLARLLQHDFAGTYAALKAAAEGAERERVDELLAAVGAAGGEALFEAGRRYLEREVEAGKVPREAAETLISITSLIPDPEKAYSLLSQMLDADF